MKYSYILFGIMEPEILEINLHPDQSVFIRTILQLKIVLHFVWENIWNPLWC